jgi:hypothetical protein
MDGYSRTSRITTMFTWTQSFKFLIVGNTSRHWSIQQQLKIKMHFTNTFFYACKAIHSQPKIFETCNSAWSEMFMHTLIQVKDI